MDALLDVRNLLAQGYVPAMAQDGRTVYMVQSARALRGRLAFTFKLLLYSRTEAFLQSRAEGEGPLPDSETLM